MIQCDVFPRTSRSVPACMVLVISDTVGSSCAALCNWTLRYLAVIAQLNIKQSFSAGKTTSFWKLWRQHLATNKRCIQGNLRRDLVIFNCKYKGEIWELLLHGGLACDDYFSKVQFFGLVSYYYYYVVKMLLMNSDVAQYIQGVVFFSDSKITLR